MNLSMPTKIYFIGILAIFSVFLASAELSSGVDLGKMDGWDIVVDSNAIASEVYAAEELAKFFEEASGVELPIVTEISRPDKHIFIGVGNTMQKSNVGFCVKDFGQEDLRIVIRNNNIAIAGGQPRGTLYGVYEFLEDYVGVRFLTKELTYVPKIGLWHVISPVNRFYSPPLSYRNGGDIELNDEVFAARMRNNACQKASVKVGGKNGFIITNHSYYRQVSTEKYSQTHPEYFAMVDGKRRVNVPHDAGGDGTQLCPSNPDLVDIMIQSLIEDIEHPASVAAGRLNYSISQNDNGYYCRCPDCAAIDEKEQSHMGTPLTLVNKVAEIIEKKYPDVTIGTLAYQFSRKPPKNIRPRKNVQIQLCSIECSIFIPINNPKNKNNESFCKDLQGWSKIADHISIWSYNANFGRYALPFPGLRVLDDNIRFFISNGTKELYMQGPSFKNTDMSEIRNYVTCKLMWNPVEDSEALIDEFIRLYYGNAAAEVRKYINLVHDTAERQGSTKVHYDGTAKKFGFDRQFIGEALVIFDQALKDAENETVRNRVEKLSIGVYAASVDEVWDWVEKYKRKIEGKQVYSELANKTIEHARKLFELGDKHNVTAWQGAMKINQAKELLRQAYGFEKW